MGEPLHPQIDDRLSWEIFDSCDAAYFTGQDPATLAVARRARLLVVTARRSGGARGVRRGGRRHRRQRERPARTEHALGLREPAASHRHDGRIGWRLRRDAVRRHAIRCATGATRGSPDATAPATRSRDHSPGTWRRKSRSRRLARTLLSTRPPSSRAPIRWSTNYRSPRQEARIRGGKEIRIRQAPRQRGHPAGRS